MTSNQNASKIKDSLGTRTENRDQYTDSRYDDYYSESEEDESAQIDSQISGIDSLSQTYKSKVSSKHFRGSKMSKKSQSRRGIHQAHNQTNSSRFNDTDDSRQYPLESESVGIKTRNDRNNDSISYGPSNDSWGAKTPREALVETRVQEEDQEQFRPFRSPEGAEKSLIFNESMGQDIMQKNSQIVEQNYRGSRLDERSNISYSKTLKKKKIKKGIGNIRADEELMNVLTDENQERNNHIKLDENYERKLEKEYENEKVNDYESKKIKYENRKMKEELAYLKSSHNVQVNQLNKYQKDIADLSSQLNAQE